VKNSVITLSFILTLASVVVSCSHQQSGVPDRYVASEGCKVKGEYHAYFAEVEKCLEKEHQK
jgi:hypothetical protein